MFFLGDRAGISGTRSLPREVGMSREAGYILGGYVGYSRQAGGMYPTGMLSCFDTI